MKDKGTKLKEDLLAYLDKADCNTECVLRDACDRNEYDGGTSLCELFIGRL